MKRLKLIITLLIFLLASSHVEAQFFKKLAEKAEKKIEREAEKRAEKRVNKKIDKTFDTTEGEIDSATKKKTKTNNTTKLPTTYAFDWKMTMQIQSKDGSIDMHYLIKQDATYFGVIMEIPEKSAMDMITIMDMENNITITLVNMEGNKIMRVTDVSDLDNDNNQSVTVVETDTKKILGYLCQGYRVDTEDGVTNMYVAINAPVSFNRTLTANPKLPKGFNSNLLKKMKNGLMMEMNFVSKKKKKYNAKMVCIALDKNKQTVSTKGYKTFGF